MNEKELIEFLRNYLEIRLDDASIESGENMRLKIALYLKGYLLDSEEITIPNTRYGDD